ncbi:MAG: YbjN domain-containing protein, partial [Bradyrhizobium sp.]
MSLLEGIVDSQKHPLAVVEDIAVDNNWLFERSGDDEVTIVSRGEWTDYQLSFTWMSELEALHLA